MAFRTPPNTNGIDIATLAFSVDRLSNDLNNFYQRHQPANFADAFILLSLEDISKKAPEQLPKASGVLHRYKHSITRSIEELEDQDENIDNEPITYLFRKNLLEPKEIPSTITFYAKACTHPYQKSFSLTNLNLKKQIDDKTTRKNTLDYLITPRAGKSGELAIINDLTKYESPELLNNTIDK
jgi:hypothetical protein